MARVVNRSARKHGRTPRVLIAQYELDVLANLMAEVSAVNHDPEAQFRLNHWAERLFSLAHGKAYRPAAPKGHATVPKELICRAVSAIDEGAGEFEDAERYCTLAEDRTSLRSKSTAARHIAAQLRKYVGKH